MEPEFFFFYIPTSDGGSNAAVQVSLHFWKANKNQTPTPPPPLLPMKNKNKEINPKLTEPPESNSNFTSMVMRAAVARICQSVGFSSTSQSVLDIFASIASKYLGALTQSAATSASLSDLTSPTCNLVDIVYALEDLSSNRGFIGASDVIRPLLNSSQLTDLIRFSASIQKTKSPNPISIVHHDQQQQQTHWSSDSGLNLTENVKRYSHIPDWLPPIPDMKLLLCDDDNKRSRKSDEVLYGTITTTTTKKEDLDLFVGGYCDMGKKTKKLEATELPNNREKVRFKMGGNGLKRPRPPLTIMGINGVNKSENVIGLVDLKSRVICKGRRNNLGYQNLEKKKKKKEQEDHLLLNSNKIIQ